MRAKTCIASMKDLSGASDGKTKCLIQPCLVQTWKVLANIGLFIGRRRPHKQQVQETDVSACIILNEKKTEKQTEVIFLLICFSVWFCWWLFVVVLFCFLLYLFTFDHCVYTAMLNYVTTQQLISKSLAWYTVTKSTVRILLRLFLKFALIPF